MVFISIFSEPEQYEVQNNSYTCQRDCSTWAAMLALSKDVCQLRSRQDSGAVMASVAQQI